MRDSDTTVPAHGGEADAPSRRPREETARLGDEIYEQAIRPHVEADHQGRSSPLTWTAGITQSRRTL